MHCPIYRLGRDCRVWGDSSRRSAPLRVASETTSAATVIRGLGEALRVAAEPSSWSRCWPWSLPPRPSSWTRNLIVVAATSRRSPRLRQLPRCRHAARFLSDGPPRHDHGISGARLWRSRQAAGALVAPSEF